MQPESPKNYRDRKLSLKTPAERVANMQRVAPATARPWDEDLSRATRIPRSPIRSQETGATTSPPGRSGKIAVPPDLTPVEDPLTPAMARHLLRRTGFGARPEQVEEIVGVPANQAVRDIVRAPHGFAVYRRPVWVNEKPPHAMASDAAWEAFFELNDAWTAEYLRSLIHEWTTGSLAQRMTLFWHDHFATSYDKYELASFAVKHVELLRGNAVGSFRTLVHRMTTDPAMLIYLDGALNDRYAPNENYARELLELFTMGREGPDGTPNYNEHDVSELARAMTGFGISYESLTSVFHPSLFDEDDKTIFGRTNPYNHESAVNLIFLERGDEVAFHIAGKLFREFVHQEPDHDTLLALGTEFKNRIYHVGNFLETLLSSRLFFDSENAVAARIKSPIELLVGQVREFGIPATGSLHEAVYWEAADAGQQILFPPNVAGWSGHIDWLSTSTMPIRWSTTSWFTYFGGSESDLALLNWAVNLAPTQDAADVFRLAHAMLEHLMPVPVEMLSLPRRPTGLGGDLQQFPIPDTVRNELPPESIAAAGDLLSGVPWYEWDVFQPQALGLIRFFASNLFRRPEYQLI
ncbi:MAG: DUF1800 family protein [Rhodothermales bacterium]|nr:DUF1800 family protein [Rhodothermales bacterium]